MDTSKQCVFGGFKLMVVIIQDNEIRNVKLTGDEITMIIEELERQPHNIYEFMGYEKIVKKFKDAIGVKEVKNGKII